MATTGHENLDRIPYGVRVFRLLPRPSWISRMSAYRLYIFILSYLLYVSYHIVRRPLGVVKNVLRQQNCTGMVPSPELMVDYTLHNKTWCAWEPFDKGSQQKFSVLDFVYRFSYAVGMFFAGHIAERMDIRLFMTIVMVIAGLWVIFGGLAYFWTIHAFSYFVVAQAFGGLFQGTGWPSVVTIMGNWFGKKRRGLIFGIWNTDTSVGNIIGSLIAGVWVNHEWGYSFVVPGLIISICGIFAYFLVIVRPEDVGLPTPDHTDEVIPKIDETTNSTTENCETEMEMGIETDTNQMMTEKKPITIWAAILIPGVIEYSICLFFCKAVYYAFFFWLPVYIKDATNAGNEASADLSTVFDGGGIIGGILAGAVSDATGGSATVCGVMFLLAIPSIFCLERFIEEGIPTLIGLLLLIGLFLNGPYTLITTAVSTELGTRPSLVKNRNALTTVAAVIDGMGSLGSAFGPLIAGLLSVYGWKGVFYYLMAAQVAAVLCLTRLIYREITQWMQRWRRKRSTSRKPKFTVS